MSKELVFVCTNHWKNKIIIIKFKYKGELQVWLFCRGWCSLKTLNGWLWMFLHLVTFLIRVEPQDFICFKINHALLNNHLPLLHQSALMWPLMATSGRLDKLSCCSSEVTSSSVSLFVSSVVPVGFWIAFVPFHLSTKGRINLCQMKRKIGTTMHDIHTIFRVLLISKTTWNRRFLRMNLLTKFHKQWRRVSY